MYMSKLDDEYQKGFQRGLEGREQPEALADRFSMFRTEEEKEARERGYRAGLREQELRKQGVR